MVLEWEGGIEGLLVLVELSHFGSGWDAWEVVAKLLLFLREPSLEGGQLDLVRSGLEVFVDAMSRLLFYIRSLG